MKINIFRGDLTDVSAKKEALVINNDKSSDNHRSSDDLEQDERLARL